MTSVVVVGGGLAGLVAARQLATSGRCRPVVYETLGLPGGKAASWREAEGLLVEAGLHVCYPYHRRLLRLLAEIGASGGISWGEPALTFVHPDGAVARLRFPRLPPPLRAAIAIARHSGLSLADRLSSVAGAAEATLLPSRWHERYEGISFAEWARRRGLSEAVLARVLEPIVRGVTFLRSSEVSARAMLAYVNAVAGGAASGTIGLMRGGTGEAVVRPIHADLVRRGGHVRLRATVTRLLMREGRAVGIGLADGSEHHADLVVLAVPAHALAALLPEALRRREPLRAALELRAVPVISVVARFDRRVGGPRGLRLSPGCLFNTWIDQADVFPDLAGTGRSILQFVVAPADRHVDSWDDATLGERVIAEARRALPGARDARVERIVVTRMARAFHALVPGAEALRPPTDVGVPGLLLAGDHVRTGHNPNMESAVVSGELAARRALELLA